jgi:endonuclease/exonuclease/phosphatase (EEP) superfamily protein YafD
VAAAGARRHWPIWVAVVPVVLWAIVRSLGLDGGSILVPLLAFTPYAAIAAFFVAGVAAALRNWAAAVLAAVAMLFLAAAVLPRAVGDGTASAAGHETLDVLSANVHRGTADPEALKGLVERFHPDLFSVQEMTATYVGRFEATGVGRLLPYRILAVDPTRPKQPGLALYSRLPLRTLAVASSHALPVIVRMPDGRRLRIVDVHPHTPKPGHIGEWRASLEALPSAGAGPPWVLVGDFNATLDQAELREVVDRGYRDAGDVAGKGLEPTWPEGKALPPLITIDHLLADRRLGVVEYSVEDQPGSDHRAIHAVLALP